MVRRSPLAHDPSLPRPRTPLIGRSGELAAARQLLLDEAVPLLTLNGPGGAGKTRLALALALDVSPVFADGAAFVDLSRVTDLSLVLPATAAALGVTEAGPRSLDERVRAFLRPRQFLLILDNCEHVITPAAALVADLMTACPALQVLATSRAPLRVHGEHILPVPPLPLPVRSAGRSLSPSGVEDLEQIASVALFVQGARAVDPHFILTTASAETVAEICRQLDGLPLGIELAAARTRLLSPQALLALLNNRLRVLTGGPRDAPPRLRTMGDALSWSHDLLDPDAQELFRRLGAFAGGWDLDAAVVVVGRDRFAMLEGLEALCDQSLLVRLDRRAGSASATPRYGMLETVREFAITKLEASGEADLMRATHAYHFLALAEEADTHLRQSDQAAWFDRLEQDYPNLLAALVWYRSRGETEPALRLAVALGHFWEARCFLAEGRRWLEDLLSASDVAALPPSLVAAGLIKLGLLIWTQGDFAHAVGPFEEALVRFQEAGNQRGIAVALRRVGMAVKMCGDFDRAALLYEESLALFQRLGDDTKVATLCHDLGALQLAWGNLADAEQRLTEAMEPARRTGDRWLLASTLCHGAEAIARQSHDARAEPLLSEAVAHFRAIGEPRWIAYVESLQGLRAAARGDHERAVRLIADALAVHDELGVQFKVAEDLERLAAVAAGTRSETAVRLLGAAEALREAIGAPMFPVDRVECDRAVATTRARLGAEQFEAAWAAGRRLTVEAAVTEALALAGAFPSRADAEASPFALPDEAFGLSRRELQVLRLLTRGQTDKEIAAALFLSPRTINAHVARLFAKLGVNNRRSAAALAAREGLI